MAHKLERKKGRRGGTVFVLKKDSADIKSVNWEKLAAVLPTDRSGESRKFRVELFKSWDPNGNGYLSLAELDRGLMITLGIHADVQRAIAPSVQRAYRGAKDSVEKKDGPGNDYVERNEFRIFCEFFRYDLHLLMLFQDMDTTEDNRVERKEFITFMRSKKISGLPEMSDDELNTAFDKMDDNKGGVVLYNEFAEYMIKMKVANPSTSVQKIANNATIQTPKASARTRPGSSSKPKSSTKKTKPKTPRTPMSTEGKRRTSRGPAPSPVPALKLNRLNSNQNSGASTAEIAKLLAAMEGRITAKIDANQKLVVGKLSKMQKALQSSALLGAPTVSQKVKTLISQVASLTTAMTDVSLLLEEKSGGKDLMDGVDL